MEINPENVPLITDQDIISPQEREKLIRAVDEDFDRTFNRNSPEADFSGTSPALAIPAGVGFLIILFTAAFLILYLRGVSQEIESKAESVTVVRSDSEWRILEYFKDQYAGELEEKNHQILLYREKIAEYDRKIDTLRNLIIAKKEIESYLEESRKALSEDGLGNAAILERLDELEQSRIEQLSPDLADIYSMDLDEINGEIDRILEERNSSEELLNQEIALKEELLAENERLRASLEENREIREAERKKEYFEGSLLQEYGELLQLIGSGEYEQAIERSGAIREFLSSSDRSQEHNADMLYVNSEINRLNQLEKVLSGLAEEGAGLTPDEEQWLLLFRELEGMVGSRDNAGLNGGGGEDIARLEELLQSSPLLSRAFALTGYKDVPPAEEEVSPAAVPVPLGVIDEVQFNVISIDSRESAYAEVGMPIRVVRTGNEGNIVLGKGEIINLAPLKGRILSLNSTAYKPVRGDFVYPEASGE